MSYKKQKIENNPKIIWAEILKRLGSGNENEEEQECHQPQLFR